MLLQPPEQGGWVRIFVPLVWCLLLMTVPRGRHLLEAQGMVGGVNLWDGLLALHLLQRESAGLLSEGVD